MSYRLDYIDKITNKSLILKSKWQLKPSIIVKCWIESKLTAESNRIDFVLTESPTSNTYAQAHASTYFGVSSHVLLRREFPAKTPSVWTGHLEQQNKIRTYDASLRILRSKYI